MRKIIILTTIVAVSFLSIFSYVRAQDVASDPTEVNEEVDDAVRKKVQEKLEEIRLNPKAYLGIITDITDKALQIQSNSGEIQQISISDDTDFAKINSTTNNITFEDIAIGDYVIAMGYLDDTKVLESPRLLITDEFVKTNRRSIYATVTEVTKSDLTTETIDGEEFVIDPIREADYFSLQDSEIVEVNFTEIEEGDTIIAVGSLEDETLSARQIQIVKKAEIEEVNTDDEG